MREGDVPNWCQRSAVQERVTLETQALATGSVAAINEELSSGEDALGRVRLRCHGHLASTRNQ